MWLIILRSKHFRLPNVIAKARFSIILLLITCLPAMANESDHYFFATATTGGTFYPVGVALATLTKVKIEPKHGIALAAVSSAGSKENIKLLREEKAQFAILQGLYGLWAWQGSGDLKEDGKQDYLRSITMLWENVEHFAIKSDFVKSGDMSDLENLKEKWFSLGPKNSGTEGSGKYILQRLGYSPYNDFQITSIDYRSNAYAFQSGAIDGMNLPAGAPVSAVTQTFTALGKDLTVLDFTDQQLHLVNRDYPLWSRFIIAPGTYPGQDKKIATIAQPNFLAVRKDVDDEAVYLIVKTIYQNLPFLHIIHSATKAMSLGKAIEGLPVPLHPGAARYFREQGIEIPDHLIVK